MPTYRTRDQTGIEATQFIAPARDPSLPREILVRYHLADQRSVNDTNWLVTLTEGGPRIMTDEEFTAKLVEE
jgi:hypothetical protein